MPSTTLSSIVLKIAGRCNLNCSYCYMYNHEDQTHRGVPKQISDEVYDALLRRLNEYCDRRPSHGFRLGFHGGEPTLVGVERFESLARRARRVLRNNLRGFHLQTNGTLIDADWASTLKTLDINVGISLDGPEATHNAERVDHSGRGSHSAAVRGLEILRAAGIDVGVLCVVNPRKSGARTYQYFRSIGVKRVEFLLPDVSHDNKAHFYGDIAPDAVGTYMLEVLDAWLTEDDPSVRIRFFEDLFYRVGSRSRVTVTDSFGNSGTGYLIIDTDGSIEANDALRVCANGISKSGLNVLNHGFDDLHLGLPLVHQFVHSGFPLPTACHQCPERDVCGGGYPPHRYAKANAFDNPSVWCRDIQRILKEVRRHMSYESAEASAGS